MIKTNSKLFNYYLKYNTQTLHGTRNTDPGTLIPKPQNTVTPAPRTIKLSCLQPFKLFQLIKLFSSTCEPHIEAKRRSRLGGTANRNPAGV